MKKRIIFFIVMASLIYSGLFAQSPPKNGIGFLDAIPVTLSAGQSSFTDTRNTSEPAYGQYRYFHRERGHMRLLMGVQRIIGYKRLRVAILEFITGIRKLHLPLYFW